MKNVIVSLLLILSFSLIIDFNVQAFDTNKIDVNTQNSTQLENTSENKAQEQQIENFYNYISNMKTKNEVLKDLDAKDYVKNFIKSGDGKISFKKIMNLLVSYGFREVIACIKLLVLLIVIALICALLTNLQRAFSSEGLSNIAYFACYSLIIIIMAKSFYIGVDVARSAIKEMSDFMTALIPVLVTLIASAGGFVEASIMDPVIIGAITISTNLFTNIIIPVISSLLYFNL